jgi:hypothetical protein
MFVRYRFPAGWISDGQVFRNDVVAQTAATKQDMVKPELAL